MKTPIELLKELNEVGKERPGLHDTIKIDDCILVAAMVQLAQDLKDFKKSKPVASGYQEEIPPEFADPWQSSETALSLPSRKEPRRTLRTSTEDLQSTSVSVTFAWPITHRSLELSTPLAVLLSKIVCDLSKSRPLTEFS
jgi:hypothetical protein